MKNGAGCWSAKCHCSSAQASDVTESTRNALSWLLRNLAMPWVIDADGLNNLALDIDRLRDAQDSAHSHASSGRDGSLINKDTATVNRDRVGTARSFAVQHRCHIVLKGARTVIATPDGKVSSIPPAIQAWRAVAWAMFSRGYWQRFGPRISREDAMKLGVYLHGFVGDRVAVDKGQIGLIASDIIEGLPPGMRALSTAAP